MKLNLYKADTIGAAASMLCLVHCVVTPFIFIAKSCSLSCQHGAPVWWKSIDYFFISISFFAIYRATQTSSSQMMKVLLWSNWIVLFFVILNEKIDIIAISEIVSNSIALSLAVLHVVNLRFCQCNDTGYCSTIG